MKNKDLIFFGGKLIKNEEVYFGIKINDKVDKNLNLNTEALIKYSLKNHNHEVKQANGRIILLYDFEEKDEHLLEQLVLSLNKKYSSFLYKLISGSNVKISFEHINSYKFDIRMVGFEKAEFRFIPIDFADNEPRINYRTSENIQNKNKNSHILSYELFPPVSEQLSLLYEKYVELEDLGKLPTKTWLNELNNIILTIDRIEIEKHLEYVLDKMVEFQNYHNEITKKINEANKKNGVFKNYRDFVPVETVQEAPTHFYFYTSTKGRYLKGLINSVILVETSNLLEILWKFAKDCPFQSNGISQAPTGLYIYDILNIFANTNSPKAINYLFSLQKTIKQKRPKKRILKVLNKIAEDNNISFAELERRYINGN